MPEKEIIIEIALERLRDFPGSPFSVTMDEPMKELIESIMTYGILTPLIVRPVPDGYYQIISGHRRKYAAVQLEYRKVPVIIRAMNDDQALVAMVDSNLNREHIRISEKAFAYRMKYDVVKREGKHPKEYFYGEKYRGIKTIEFMGREQKDSPKQVQRMLNVTRLIPELLRKLDEGKLGFTPAAELALLCKEEQYLLNDAMEYTQTAPTLSQAIRIKHIADREDLTMKHLVSILNENNRKVLKRVVFADESIYRYFSPEESPQTIKEEILRMLQEKKKRQESDAKAGSVPYRKSAGIPVNPSRDAGNAAGMKSKEFEARRVAQNQVVQNPATQNQAAQSQATQNQIVQNRTTKKKAIQKKQPLNIALLNRRMSRQEILELMQRRYNSKPEQSGRKEEKVNV